MEPKASSFDSKASSATLRSTYTIICFSWERKKKTRHGSVTTAQTNRDRPSYLRLHQSGQMLTMLYNQTSFLFFYFNWFFFIFHVPPPEICRALWKAPPSSHLWFSWWQARWLEVYSRWAAGWLGPECACTNKNTDTFSEGVNLASQKKNNPETPDVWESHLVNKKCTQMESSVPKHKWLNTNII